MNCVMHWIAILVACVAFMQTARGDTPASKAVNASAYYQAAADPMPDDAWFSKLMLDQLEWQGRKGESQFAWDAQGWLGGDFRKIWIKTEGARADGQTEDAEAQLLYDQAISGFFDLQAGVRHDWATDRPDRDWLALGVQGLAPYFFETAATVFVGKAGRSALRLKASYDLLFSQRLILTPELETNVYGRDDPALGIGHGLGDASLGLRLRYEIRREVAPYLGLEVQRRYGATADYARAAGDTAGQTLWVAGLRVWF